MGSKTVTVVETETVDEIETDENEIDETRRTRQTNYHQPLPVLTLSFHKTIDNFPDIASWLTQWADQNGYVTEFREGGRKGLSNRLFCRIDTPETYAVRTASTASDGTRKLLSELKAKAEGSGMSVEDLLRAALAKL